MASSSVGSATRDMRDFVAGRRPQEAAERLFDRYYKRLIRYAASRLDGGNAIRSIADEEDAVLRAFAEVFRKMEEGTIQLGDRGDLQRVLYCITRRRVSNQVSRHPRDRPLSCARAAGRAHDDADSGEDGDYFGRIPSREPSPEVQAIIAEAVQVLYEHLDKEDLQKVLTLRLSGYTNKEIASALNRAESTVERKVALIRNKFVVIYRGEYRVPGLGDALRAERAS